MGLAAGSVCLYNRSGATGRSGCAYDIAAVEICIHGGAVRLIQQGGSEAVCLPAQRQQSGARLEEELHITIFQRTPSGVVITNEGWELLKLGNKLLRSRPHAFMSHSHPLAQRASVTPEELMDYPCIVYEQSADSPAFYSEEMLLPNFYPPRVVYISDLYVSTALMRSCNAYDIGTGVISPRLAREVACVAIDTADTVDIGWIGIRGKALRPIEEAFLRHLAHQLEMAKA